MGKTTYSKIQEMIKHFKKETMTFYDLQTLIMKYVGSDPRTIKNVLNVLTHLGKIKDVGNSRFEVKIN